MGYSLCERNTERLFDITDEQWQKNCNDKHLLLRYLAIPLKETDQKLWLAIDDENNLNACEIFSFIVHKEIEPVLVASDDLKYLLNELSPDHSSPEEHSEITYISSQPENEGLNPHDPIIQMLDKLFKFCLSKNASDIHIEPRREKLVIRLRIDGVLHLYKTLSHHLASRIISRLKLLAKLDISESRLPQDGQFRFTTQLADTLDFRVSTLPTSNGEKLVLRIQKNKPTHFDFHQLGCTLPQKETLLHALQQPQGLILVTGPTGSGKSITLYTAAISTRRKSIF